MSGVRVTLPADVQQIDETDLTWTFLHEASEPDRVYPGAVIVAGDPDEPVIARVVDVVDKPAGAIVHLEILGTPEQVIDELRHAGLLPGVVTSPCGWRHPDDRGEVNAADHPPAPEPDVGEAAPSGRPIVEGDELVRRRPADAEDTGCLVNREHQREPVEGRRPVPVVQP